MSFSQGFLEPTVGRKSVHPGPVATGWTKQSIDDLAAQAADEFGYRAGADLGPVIRGLGGETPLFATRQAGNRAEWEANWFAAAFLMPAGQFVDVWNESGGSIGRLINHFQVSGGAIEIRRKTLEEFGKLS